jgi:AraC-like DNA-binding protein
MDYRELIPAPRLRRYIRCYWTLRASAPEASAAQRVLPDGCVEIIVNLGDQFLRHDAAGQVERQPRTLVVGPTTRHMSIAPTGVISLVGIRFAPGGALPFLPGTEAAILDLALAPQLDRARRIPDRRISASVRAAFATQRSVSVDALVQLTGWGARQLERQFRDTVGFGPKTLCRLARFQRIVRAVEPSNRPSWARLAAHAGYADQSHLAREFREFAGTTLTDYVRELHPMSDHFHTGTLGDDLTAG